MFTGLVEVIGEILEYNQLDRSDSGGNGVSLTIGRCGDLLSDCHLGDSIAVNGVCLTVTEFTTTEFKVGVAPETLRRTNLGQLKTGSRVNLERAVSGSVRFGGHFVQGHVDTVCTITDVHPDGNAVAYTFRPRDDVLRYVAEKSFISLDGTSLTVTAVDDDAKTFSVMLVAYTQDKVIMTAKKVGDLVNVEVDFMGKLVEKQAAGMIERMVAEKMKQLSGK